MINLKLFLFLLTFIFLFINKTNASLDEPKIIGCIANNLETREISDQGNCLFGNDWHNIYLPPKSHMNIWKDVFNNNSRQIINRLPIVNYESRFDPNAGNKGSFRINPYAVGYVQTLREYKISTNIKSQLTWMRDRQETQGRKTIHGKNGIIPACGSYWDRPNTIDNFAQGEDGVVACLYRWHYHASKGSWYAKKLMAQRSYYYSFFDKNPEIFNEYFN